MQNLFTLLRIYFVCAIILLTITTYHSRLLITMSSKNRDVNSPLKTITYCVNCHSPEHEGSIAHGLAPKIGLIEYTVTGELVYCVPNHAEQEELINVHQFDNRIVLVNRGKVSIQEKIMKINATDAIGILIADDGNCNPTFTFCGPRFGSINDGGFAAYESEYPWAEFNIPILLIQMETANRLRKMMRMTVIDMPPVGKQNVTIVVGSDGFEEEL